MLTFNEVWHEIQDRLSDGMEIPNWGYQEGYTGKFTRIERKYFDVIVVTGDKVTRPRDVKREDFKRVYEFWERYKQGLTPRDEIQRMSRNTTYIFSILHWLERSEENDT
jgi:hypothetical protein